MSIYACVAYGRRYAIYISTYYTYYVTYKKLTCASTKVTS